MYNLRVAQGSQNNWTLYNCTHGATTHKVKKKTRALYNYTHRGTTKRETKKNVEHKGESIKSINTNDQHKKMS